MKNFIFIFCILFILLKTGNVLSNNNIFNVNNVEISEKISTNTEKLINKAFQKGFEELTKRLLLDQDRLNLTNINLKQIKELILYYQIINPEKENDELEKIKVNVFFDKEKMHNFFYDRNLLYSDIINTNVVLFPLLKKNNQLFIFNQNYFYKNWNIEKYEDLLQYSLPEENIESIQKINLNKENFFDLDIEDFFKEYESNSKVFSIIEINKKNAEIILSTKINKKKIKKSFTIINKKNLDEKELYNKIIFEIKKQIRDLIKSQNLIDVSTPSFLNVNINVNEKNNLFEFSNRLKKIDLVDDFYVSELNKDHVLVKIKFFGKIDKIINKMRDQNIDLKIKNGEWQINIIS